MASDVESGRVELIRKSACLEVINYLSVQNILSKPDYVSLKLIV